ncbi:MAG: DUF1800 domain-containing protein [Betaproteobacteria bacterium]
MLWVGTSLAVATPMGSDEARLLLARTGFAAAEMQVDQFAQLSRTDALDRLLAETTTTSASPPPAWTSSYDRPSRENLATIEQREAYRKEQQRRAAELRAWWFGEMLTTPSPLTEKMTLFWHNHFVSAQQKVRIPQLMYAQNQLLRRHALGNFRTMLRAVARDPAMLIYLDTAGSRVGAPNENFAREVMELFTLGEGHYGETDIKEAARALTGWNVNRETGEVVYRPRLHDYGMKTIFGSTGRFDMDSVLDLTLRKPEAANFVVSKLWKEFISPTPDAAEVERFATVFRDRDYEIRPLLRVMLTSDAFYAASNRGTLVKSPVDLVVGTLREFRFQLNEPKPFVNVLRQLGQDLFNPPNVKGWPGGDAWINSSSLLARKQLMERLFRFDQNSQSDPLDIAAALSAEAPMMQPVPRPIPRAMNGTLEFDSARWLARYAARDDGAARMTATLLPVAPVQARTPTTTLAGIRQLVLDPAYQLK